MHELKATLRRTTDGVADFGKSFFAYCFVHTVSDGGAGLQKLANRYMKIWKEWQGLSEFYL